MTTDHINALTERLRGHTMNANTHDNKILKMASDCGKAADEIDRLTAEVERLEKDNEEMTLVFDTGWEADQRAIKDWQEITGRKKVWPDRADMVVTLLMLQDLQDAELETLETKADALADAADQCLDDMGENGKSVCQAAKEWLQAALLAYQGEK